MGEPQCTNDPGTNTFPPADVRVSFLERGVSVERRGDPLLVSSTLSLAGVAELVWECPDLKRRTEALDAILRAEGRSKTYDAMKKRMPAIIPAALAPAGTHVAQMPANQFHNGCFGYDVDERREGMDLPAVRASLIDSPGAAVVAMSCGGDALWVMYGGPPVTTDSEYKLHWRHIRDLMPENARVNNGRHSINFNRLRFLRSDVDLWLPEQVTRLPGPTKREDDHTLDLAALQWIPPQDYNHWLGWFGCLKALGFTPEEVDAWASRGDGYDPGEVAEKWDAISFNDDPTEARKVLRGHAHNLGWRPPGGSKGSNPGSQSARAAKDPKEDLERAAVRKAIEAVVAAGRAIYWLGDYYEPRRGQWERQDVAHYRRLITRTISQVQKSIDGVALVGRLTMHSYLDALQDAVTPACVDTALLAEDDRLELFNLDTGELVSGAAFQNGVLHRGVLKPMDPQWFCTTSRPYPFPEQDPGRPDQFDEWLAGRLPDRMTRQAVWELLGATILQELHRMQRMVALVGAGRSGKGTLLRLVRMLIGELATISFSGGPARLAKSQFSTGHLQRAALILFPDMPRPPSRDGFARDIYNEGLSIIRQITGGDAITIERKRRDPVTARVNAAVWVDSNFDLDFVQGGEDAISWQERLLIIPFELSMAEGERVKDFEERFRSELGAIAYHAVAAYNQVQDRGTITRSSEMNRARAKLVQGKLGELEGFLSSLQESPGAWISRKDLRKAAEAALKRPLTNREANHLYNYVKDLWNVTEGAREGIVGFHGLVLSQS